MNTQPFTPADMKRHFQQIANSTPQWNMSVSVTSSTVKHPLINKQHNNNILEQRERKEKPYKLFEEITINATQMLVQLFWLLLAIILLCGVAMTKTQPKPKPD